MRRRSSKTTIHPEDIKFCSEYPIIEYKCGLRAGDRVRLKKGLHVVDPRNRPTGEVHPKGEIWIVLRGCADGRIDVWFRQPDGNPHTWDDNRTSIDEWFEVIDHPSA